jgi:hypothetical protein
VSGNYESTSAAYFHTGKAFVPTGNDLSGPQRKRERFTTIPRSVELFARGRRNTDVVDNDGLTRLGFFARANNEVFN